MAQRYNLSINERRGKSFLPRLPLSSIILIPFLFNHNDQPFQEYHQLARPFKNIPLQLPVIRNFYPKRPFGQPDNLSVLHQHPVRRAYRLRQINSQHQFRYLHFVIVRCPDRQRSIIRPPGIPLRVFLPLSGKPDLGLSPM